MALMRIGEKPDAKAEEGTSKVKSKAKASPQKNNLMNYFAKT